VISFRLEAGEAVSRFRGFRGRRRPGTGFVIVEHRSWNVRHRTRSCQGPLQGSTPHYKVAGRRIIGYPGQALRERGLTRERDSFEEAALQAHAAARIGRNHHAFSE
jgi:hypothetical protein